MNNMKYRFERSFELKLQLPQEDFKQISCADNIKKALEKPNTVGFDIYYKDKMVAFAMLRDYGGGYFLWNYAVDKECRNQGLGSSVLLDLFEFLKTYYNAREITTTYIYGNGRAKHIYEKAGFTQTDVVEEDGIHEVNMVINLQ